MQMQASVVHVNGTYHGFRVITGKYLGMYKPRHILIDLHAGLKKLRVIRPGQEVRIDLIRNMRHDDDRLNTALCRKRQRSDHITVQDQIRCHDMHIIAGFV